MNFKSVLINSFPGYLLKTVSLLLLLFLLHAQIISARQNDSKTNPGKISGILIDSQTRNPIEFANFILTSIKDTSVIFGTVSGKEGKFQITGIPLGLYNAKISLVGYKPRTRKNILFSTKVQEIKLDTVLLMPLDLSLKEVQIIAERDRIVYDQNDKTKIIINPDKDWGNNALDLLENTPMVDVDIESGAINLFGKKGTVIYIDGNPAKFSGIMSNEDLRSLSASEIDKFELIMNPGIEYGENSGGGVINITTKNIKTTKYNGTVSSSANTNNQYDGSLGGAYNFKDITIRGNYINNYSHYNVSSNQSRQLVLADVTNYLNQLSESGNKSNSNVVYLNITMNTDKFTSLSDYTSYRDGFYKTRQNYSNTYLDNNNSQNDVYLNNSNSKTLQNFFTQNIKYSRQFEEKGRFLNISFSYSNNHNNLQNDIIQNHTSSISPLNGSDITSRNTSANSNNDYSWAATYSHPFNKVINIFTSYSGQYKKLSMNDNYYSLDPALQLYLMDALRKVNQDYTDINHSVGFGLNATVYDIQGKFGLRANNKFTSTENKVLNNSYQNWFTNFDPSVGISTDIAEGQNIGFNYRSMTMYPPNRMLSPYVNYSDSTNIVVGNPELKPMVWNNYSIGYHVVIGDLFLAADVGYHNNDNTIESVTSIINSRVVKTTYENLSSNNGFGCSTFFRKKIDKWLEISPRFGWSSDKYISRGISSQSSSWSTGFRSDISFNTFKFQMDLNYRSPWSDAQEKSKANFYVNAAAKLFLFDKQLSLTLRAADLFNTKNNNSNISGAGFSMVNTVSRTTRIFTFDLSYYFQSKASDTLDDERRDTVLPEDF